MIRCNLSTILGSKRMKISELADASELNRSTNTALYNDTAKRIELEAISKICLTLDGKLDELFTLVHSE